MAEEAPYSDLMSSFGRSGWDDEVRPVLRWFFTGNADVPAQTC